MNKELIFFIVLMAFFGLLKSQSIFSFYGPTEISYQRDIYGEGMGGTGLGDLYRQNTSLLNPALSTTIDRVHFSTALSMGNIYFRDSEGRTFRDDQVYLPYFNIIFPIKQHRIGVHYQNISSGRLDTEKRTEISLNDEVFGVLEIQRQDFSLFKAGIFYANQNDLVNFGIGINYLFGHNVRYSQQIFDDHDFVSGRFESEHTFKNPSFDIGLAKMSENISTGLSLSMPVELQGDKYFKTNTLNEFDGNATYEYPARVAMGVTWKLQEKIYFSTDIDMEFWGYSDNIENSINTIRAGIGMSWTGNNESRNVMAHIPLRAGFSTRNMPYQINGNQIQEMTYHAGFSIPLKNYESYLDFAVKYFSRGDENKHNFSEDGFLISIGTSGFDFFRRRTDRKSPREIPVPDRRF
ncbi:MAG: hypothetical protein FWG98_06135 [Candidatus Cloacimonetes bacterium]|nr:hypothetical protein [Candidatus Cloacimonadota bacterium]